MATGQREPIKLELKAFRQGRAPEFNCHGGVGLTPMRPLLRMSSTAFNGDRNIRVPTITPILGTTVVKNSCLSMLAIEGTISLSLTCFTQHPCVHR